MNFKQENSIEINDFIILFLGMRLGLLMTKIAIITILSEYTLSNDQKGETLMKPVTVFNVAVDGLHVSLKKRS